MQAGGELAVSLSRERAHLTQPDEELAASDRAILEAYPPRVMAARIEQRLRRPRRVWLVGLVAVAALLLFQLSPGPSPSPSVELEPARAKGLPELRVHREDGARLLDQDPARPGDRVMISYIAAGQAHGAIFSLDGAGSLTQHYPLQGDLSVPLEPGGAHTLERSFTLDAAPEFERFFLVTDEQPFELAPVRRALSTQDDPVLDQTLSTLTLRKAP